MAKQIRHSSGAIVWRANSGEPQIMLVRSSSGKGWVFPKGGIESNLTAQQNAVKEVWEEAGVVGHLGQCVGHYRYTKAEVQQRVVMYEMEAVAILESYPEADIRARRWFVLSEAYGYVSKDLRKCLEQFEAVVLGNELEAA